MRLAGRISSSIETSARKAPSLSRAQPFLLVFQSRKVGPDFPVLALPGIAGVCGSIVAFGLLAPPSKGIEKRQALDQPGADLNS